MIDFAQARMAMVEGQVRANDVTDRALLAALRAVPRELFAAKARRALVYGDAEVEVGPGRWLLRPRDFAKLAQALEIKPSDVVLDIACGRGYSTAVFARMATTVVALESDPELARRATELLGQIDALNTAVITGDLKAGAPDHGPFDAIFVNGAVTAAPETWLAQLADAGRLGVIERDGPVGRARIYTKSGGVVGARTAFDSAAPLLPGFEMVRGFAF